MPHNDRHQLKMNAITDFGIMAARAQLGKGESRMTCADCDEPIPEARRKASIGCQYCIACQSEHDHIITIPYGKR